MYELEDKATLDRLINEIGVKPNWWKNVAIVGGLIAYLFCVYKATELTAALLPFFAIYVILVATYRSDNCDLVIKELTYDCKECTRRSSMSYSCYINAYSAIEYKNFDEKQIEAYFIEHDNEAKKFLNATHWEKAHLFSAYNSLLKYLSEYRTHKGNEQKKLEKDDVDLIYRTYQKMLDTYNNMDKVTITIIYRAKSGSVYRNNKVMKISDVFKTAVEQEDKQERI